MDISIKFVVRTWKVVRPNWVDRCIEAKEIWPFAPDELITIDTPGMNFEIIFFILL